MAQILSFYLDGSVVQAVLARKSASGLSVLDARSFAQEELERYLGGCREKSCILSCNPAGFHQDIVHLPAATAKFYDTLVRAEVRKEHPELDCFSLFYRTVGEETIDGTAYHKIAAFSYPDESFLDYLSLFNRCGMTVTHLYAAAYPIFRLAVSASGEADAAQPRVVIAALPGEKLILLSERRELEFIRKIPAAATALLPADSLSINTTIDYCFQSLRVRPTAAVLLNCPESATEPTPVLAVPARHLSHPALAGVPADLVRDYLAPLAAVLHHGEHPRTGDILPAEYVAFTRNRKLLSAGTAVLLVFVLLLAAFLVVQRLAIQDEQSRIRQLRASLAGSGEAVAAYRRLDQELTAYNNPIAFLGKLNMAISPETALANLISPARSDLAFKVVNIKKDEAGVNLHIEGVITAAGFKDTQAAFESVVEQVSKIPGYSVSSSAVDVKQKTFKLEARFNRAGQGKL